MIIDLWKWFCLTFGLMLLTTLIMTEQGRRFRTNDGTTRKFSILDLEFAANGKEIINLIKGIYKLPTVDAKRVLSALRGQLFVDFLYMPAVYGSIFLLCRATYGKLSSNFGKEAFYWAAWAQGVSLLCDIGENIYLLTKIKPEPALPSNMAFRIYTINEWIKWGIACLGAIGSLSCMLYFWLTGEYFVDSLSYAAILIGELLIFFWVGKALAKRYDRCEKENLHLKSDIKE